MKCVPANLSCAVSSAGTAKGKLNSEWRLLWIKPSEATMVVAILKAAILASALKSAKRLLNP